MLNQTKILHICHKTKKLFFRWPWGPTSVNNYLENYFGHPSEIFPLQSYQAGV